jgi:ribosome maturation factor RimP
VKLLAATESWLEATMAGLGYELVDVETSGAGLLRIFIDKPAGISVEDCARVSNHLSRSLAVEGIDYERLEVSSPGLDRPVKRFEDFSRFSGQDAKLRMRLVVDGQRRFEGVLRGTRDRNVLVEVEGKVVELPFEGIERARLKPAL